MTVSYFLQYTVYELLYVIVVSIKCWWTRVTKNSRRMNLIENSIFDFFFFNL